MVPLFHHYSSGAKWRGCLAVTNILILLLACVRCAGQDPTAPKLTGVGFEGNYIAGKVFKHEAKFTLPIPDISTGVDVNVLWHTHGKKDWQQRRHYPRLGLGVIYINYGMDSVYGRMVGLYPNLTLPLISTRKMEWTLRIGDGIGYVTRQYSRINPTDTVNVAIGSRVNDLLMITTDIRYHINKHWDMQAGVNVTHISNGSVRKPNLGVNMAGGHIGIRYFPVTSTPAHISRQLQPLGNRYLVQVRGGMSLVSAYTVGGPLYPVYVATGYVSRRWRSHNKVFAGIDYSYHTNIYAFLRNNELATGREKQHSYKSAIVAGNEFLLGRVGISLQAGVYIKQAYLHSPDVYQKITGSYYFVLREQGPVKELFIYTSLKTHLSVAELGELGLGIGL